MAEFVRQGESFSTTVRLCLLKETYLKRIKCDAAKHLYA